MGKKNEEKAQLNHELDGNNVSISLKENLIRLEEYLMNRRYGKS